MKLTNSLRIIIDIFILLRTQMTTVLTLEMNMSLRPMLTPKPSLSQLSFLKEVTPQAPTLYTMRYLSYIPTAWKIATLHLLLKPDKLPSLTTSYRPISLISSIMKPFDRVIGRRLRSHPEHTGLSISINQASEKLSLLMTIFLDYPNPSWKALTEENM